LAGLYLILWLIIRRADGVIKQQYHELQINEEALRQARDTAVEASQFKSRLLANVSHDMRTPINAIMGYGEMLEAGIYGPVSDKQKGIVNGIIQSSGILMEFVSNLLDQAQLDSSKLNFDIKPFSPVDLVRDVHTQLDLLARAKGISFTSTVAADMPDKLLGDRYWLRQIALNLVNNAIKFTDEGGVTLNIFRQDGLIAFQVSDTGIGIPAAEQKRIFEPFEQVNNIYAGSVEGSGLGLSIVKEITTLMQGKVALQSVLGEGSTFTITLPLAPVEAGEV